MEEINKDQLWKEVLENIRLSVSSANFSTWFVHTFIYSSEEINQRLIVDVGCKSNYEKNTIENRYFGLVQDALSKLTEKPIDLVFSVRDNPSTPISSKPTPLFEQQADKNLSEHYSKAGIRPTLTFDNYAVSSSNQMAWAAAEAVSKNPGSAYNPLFIWGGVGVGKTHLMNAIGYEIIKNNPSALILSCTGEQFTNDIVEGIRSKSTQNVRNKYRKLSLLFVDDIQFIAGKDAVQEEFFHTFNSIVGNGSQVILTSDKPPSEISKLEERLKSRFEAGLIVDISQPDFELRCAITQIKAKEKGVEIPMNFIQMIAGNVDSPRKIEGVLIKIMSETKFGQKEITEELVEKVIEISPDQNGKTKVINKRPEEIVDLTCKYFSISKKIMLGEGRARRIARPRQILMYILRTQLRIPLDEVGRLIGGRDHTTVMHAVDKITHLASTDVDIRENIAGIKSMI